MKTMLDKPRLIKTALASIAGLLLMPMAAQASCYINGPIVRVVQYDDSYTSIGCYIYMRSSGPLSSDYYYTRTNDDNICSSAVTAATTAADSSVLGNASSCPTTGTGRYMGEVQYLIVNP
jgi:hypothetical protein